MTTTQATPTDTVRTLFAGIDAGDLDAVAAVIADDVHFRFGNADATDGKADFAAAAQAFLGALTGIRHEIHDIWEVEDGAVIAMLDVHYKRLDGGELTLPSCPVFRVRDGLIHDFRIHMDVSPVLAP